MPELPEVETIINRVRDRLVGRCFAAVTVNWWPMIQTPIADFSQEIAGKCIQRIHRRGKYIVLSLSEGWFLIIHLKMSGYLIVAPGHQVYHDHDRIIFTLDDGFQLRFHDQRKFGRVYLTQNPEAVLGKLGPEPLSSDFTEETYLELLDGRSGRIKSLLLNQAFVAGIGNIYAAEALFLAGVHPEKRAAELSVDEKRRLYWAIRQVLSAAVELGGSSLRDATYRDGEYQSCFQVYDREGMPCPMCGTPVERVKLAQRSTYFCPHCQRQS